MRVTRGLHLFLVLMMLSAAIVFTATADAQKIHALLVTMDGDARMGAEFEKSRKRMENLLREIKDLLKLPVSQHILTSTAADNQPNSHPTKSNILNWINNARPAQDDVLLVYFCGHGGSTQSRELFLSLKGREILYRKQIVEAVTKKTCRLKLLLTDACSYGGSSVRVMPAVTLKSALRNLFLEHEGFLNAASANIGEFSLGDPSNGTWFTCNFVLGILEDYEYLDRNPKDKFVSWKEVFEYTRSETMRLFEENIGSLSKRYRQKMKEVGQTTQTPIYFGQLPKRIR